MRPLWGTLHGRVFLFLAAFVYGMVIRTLGGEESEETFMKIGGFSLETVKSVGKQKFWLLKKNCDSVSII